LRQDSSEKKKELIEKLSDNDLLARFLLENLF
jgi:hypothetical protein